MPFKVFPIPKEKYFVLGILRSDMGWPDRIDDMHSFTKLDQSFFYDFEENYPLTVVSYHAEDFPSTIRFDDRSYIFSSSDQDFETETEAFTLTVEI